MKIRSDFVSNSSSSSFIISTSHNADEMEFLVEKNFTPTDTSKIQPKIISDIRRNNRDTISVGLRNNIVLFLGDFSENVGKRNELWVENPIIDKNNNLQRDLLNHREWYYVPKTHGAAKKLEDIETKKCTPEQAKESFIETLVSAIHDYWKICNQTYTLKIENNCAEITEDTLKLTKLMIRYGMSIKVNKKLFNSVKKELEDGKHVYLLDANDEGMGLGYGSIFVSRSLDYDIEDVAKNISKISDIKVLEIEC